MSNVWSTRPPIGVLNWLANDCGNIAVLSALCMTIIFGLAGSALDFGRAYTARTQLQKSLDAAVLAAGRVLQTTQNETEALTTAQQYFDQTKPSTLTNAAASFAIENNKTLVRATVNGNVDTLVLGVLNLDSLAINVESRSEMAGGSNSGTNYELSLMLDVKIDVR